MLAAQLTQLHDDAPAGLAQALAVVDGVDDTLTRGLARVAEPDAAAWAALAEAVGGTPMAARAGEAVRAATTGALTEEHLTVLAGARAALLGAVHDALLDRLDTTLHRSRVPWAAATGTPPDTTDAGAPTGATAPGAPTGTATGTAADAIPGAAAVATAPGPPIGTATGRPADAAPARAGARAWLHELTLTGWRGADHELLSGAAAPVEAALAAPALRRLAVLLDGLAAELRAGLPVTDPARLPARRWADLWTRGVLLAAGAAAEATAPEQVSGRLLPLGVDVHEHDTAFQAQLHALLEPAGGGTPRLVRVTVGAAKVATIVGPAGWRLLEACPVLLKALAERRSMTVTDLPAYGGDLHWVDARAELAEPADPFATARVLLAGATAAATPPLQRHPAAIAEPVLVEGRVVRDAAGDLVVDLDGAVIPLAADRLPAAGPLTPTLLAAATACLGLLRWDDDRWLLQPLAVRATVKRQAVEAHNGDWACGVTDTKAAKAEARAGDAVAVLRERAGRLLRR
ncbi:hypothetical protein [Micromonospora humi]|uniref:Uncharacterized protein n=1 Tax=Micromonospora humi TaxID=745366 RepID=A0A1C5H2W0_9ACTN|nr:hypothetical protein [Micromonospora humi]SCG40360.1 hypothetical protein GA0070213_102217 [Micromonospora humi]